MNHPHVESPLRYPSRRQFLQRAGLGCGSLALAALMHEQGLLGSAQASVTPRAPHYPAKAKAVIWLFMTGSPSQVDTFDYKPELQKRDGQSLSGADPKTGFFTTSGKCLRSPFKWQQHGQSGTWVSDILPQTAQHVDDMAFIHSCHSRANNHAPAAMELMCGQAKPGYPSMGAWLTYGLGSLNQNLPAFVVMHETKPRGEDGIWSPGFLPKNFQPLLLDSRTKDAIANLNRGAGMNDGQQRAQLDLLRELNQQHVQQHPLEGELAARIQSFELAYRMQMAAPEALDLRQETAATQQLYGLGDKDTAVFGRQCLLARRLVERGVRFVQIFAGRGVGGDGSVGDVPWDGHDNIETNHRSCGKATDQPTAGLLTDLKSRGLLDDTLVIWSGEFGRTSDSQGSKGRDHNPQAFTIWLAGGGVKGGTHYGQSCEFGYKAVENRVSVHDIQATVLHLLGLDHTKLTYRFNARDFRLTDVYGNVVKEVLA
ncbi:hypothetical protein AYO44_11815 [Planctomycetaceae bacterium SCGC AG-212-F19]|nr:hypothetical protein AYO44_11815 [Planctomycetaceae bacterium SCGC AG-212-F19]